MNNIKQECTCHCHEKYACGDDCPPRGCEHCTENRTSEL